MIAKYLILSEMPIFLVQKMNEDYDVTCWITITYLSQAGVVSITIVIANRLILSEMLIFLVQKMNEEC